MTQVLLFTLNSSCSKYRAIWIELQTLPPNCRDPKDLVVLATAIDGKAEIIVSADDDLRADDELRAVMATYGIRLLGVHSFLKYLDERDW
ncbi:MAG: putative toxin-antitoxin system toxin component, PIN family [Nostoc sp.]